MGKQARQQRALTDADRLEVGDRIASFTLPDTEGQPVNPLSDHLAGRPLLLVFACAPAGDAPSYEDELAALDEQAATLQRHDALVLAVTRDDCSDNRALVAARGLSFPLLSDPKARAYAACGIDPETVGRRTVTLVLDGNLRVTGLVDGGGASRWREVAGALGKAANAEARAPAGHAPVLVLPRVLTADDCAELIRVWHRPVRVWEGDGFTTAAFHDEKSDFKVRIKDYGQVCQFVVRDKALQAYLDAKLQRRVMPEIQKAFQTKVSRREEYRIAGYDAAEGGILGPHRDNTTKPTRHRRFTLTVALNGGDFEGGGLRFREYSPDGYLVPTGTAIVWSCSLLHEVLPVTSGRRFVLGTHLFGT